MHTEACLIDQTFDSPPHTALFVRNYPQTGARPVRQTCCSASRAPGMMQRRCLRRFRAPIRLKTMKASASVNVICTLTLWISLMMSIPLLHPADPSFKEYLSSSDSDDGVNYFPRSWGGGMRYFTSLQNLSAFVGHVHHLFMDVLSERQVQNRLLTCLCIKQICAIVWVCAICLQDPILGSRVGVMLLITYRSQHK